MHIEKIEIDFETIVAEIERFLHGYVGSYNGNLEAKEDWIKATYGKDVFDELKRRAQ